MDNIRSKSDASDDEVVEAKMAVWTITLGLCLVDMTWKSVRQGELLGQNYNNCSSSTW